MEKIIEFQNMGLHIHNKPMLCDVNGVLFAGDRIALTGASGSGKSLCLRMAGLLEHPSQGSLLWKSQHIEPGQVPNYRQNVIYVNQKSVFCEGTVEDNLRLPFYFKIHSGKKYDASFACQQLQKLGKTPDFLHKSIHILSGGESQIASLLRAMLLDPVVLLLDEVTSALDPESTHLVEQFILNWQQEKPHERAFIWVTHQEAQAERISNKRWLMSQGNLNI